jgi:hypothetical protein
LEVERRRKEGRKEKGRRERRIGKSEKKKKLAVEHEPKKNRKKSPSPLLFLRHELARLSLYTHHTHPRSLSLSLSPVKD